MKKRGTGGADIRYIVAVDDSVIITNYGPSFGRVVGRSDVRELGIGTILLFH